jgi:hypothetical protein
MSVGVSEAASKFAASDGKQTTEALAASKGMLYE